MTLGHAYLDEGSATSVINALSELLRNTNIETIIFYFEKLVDNVRCCRSGYVSSVVAFKFLKVFVSKQDVSKQTLVDKFENEHQLLDLLIAELNNYMDKVKAQVVLLAAEEESAGRTLDHSKLGGRVFSDLFPHKAQLTDRMDFIKEFAKQGSFRLTHAQISQIWRAVIAANPIVSDHTTVSVWLRTICDDFLLGRDTSPTSFEELVSFYRETICAEENTFANLNLEGYYCIQSFFLLINLRADKLVVQDDDVHKANSGRVLEKWEASALTHKKVDPELVQVCAKVAPNEMDGI